METNQPDPFPSLNEQQQVAPEPLALSPVAVAIEGPVTVLELPARKGPALSCALNTTMQHILGPDPRRKRTTLICDVDWVYWTAPNGTGVPWYAKVPLVLLHADAIYAKVPTSTGTLSVIAEFVGQ